MQNPPDTVHTAPRPPSTERPIIGVTRPTRGGLINWLAVRLSIRAAGARALRITPDAPVDIDTLDGLVLTGGHDIDPRHYGERVAVRTTLDPRRDEMELDLAREAYARNLPTIGICRGMQVMTVALGGRLMQDVEPRAEAHFSPLPLWRAHIEPQSRLAALLGSHSVRINRIHHQAVDATGDALRVVARGCEGLVQGVEASDRDLFVGVQWHPEYLPYLSAQRSVFQRLIDAATGRVPAFPTAAPHREPINFASEPRLEEVGR